MPSPRRPGSTTRRRLLAAAAGTAFAGATAGCLGDTLGTDSTTADGGDDPTDATTTTQRTTREVTASGTYADAPDGPNTYPDRPTEASRVPCERFVEDFESVRTYNALHESNVEELSVSATTHHDRAAHDGQYVLATASGYANYADGVHADWGQAPALYYVSPDLVVRTGRLQDYYSNCEDVFASDDPSENFAAVCEGGDAAFRAYNMHPDAHTLSVTVHYRGDGGDERILEDEYFLGTTDAFEQGSVTYRKGTYRVTASLEGGPQATSDWELQREPTWEDPPLCILIEPTGGLVIRPVPFDRI
jgi:hypothetical protein